MARKFNFERAATALVDAVYIGDRKAAEKWAVSVKSIEGWRKRLDEDEIFREFFLKKKENYESQWAKLLPGALMKAIAAMEETFKSLDRTDPETLHVIAGAFKLMADTAIAKQVIDARSVSSNSTVG